MRSKIEKKQFDEERALYGSENIDIINCSFDGPADGESALKECKDVVLTDCYMNLRYPCWHDVKLQMRGCTQTENCRAALWYDEDVTIENCKLHGIKAVRECQKVRIKDSDIHSKEFGWFSKDITMSQSILESQYAFLRSSDIQLDHVQFSGKYSFQYIENAEFSNCTFFTKDAFWHGKNITVRDSVVEGEYLAWYSENLTFINCKIIGTQPLCYCKNLKLIDCEMIDTDLCFEKSEVEANILTPVISIKNPAAGTIYVPKVGSIIMDDEQANGIVVVDE